MTHSAHDSAMRSPDSRPRRTATPRLPTIIMDTNQIIHGDCFEAAGRISRGSVDLILTDPPYGTVQGIGDNETVSHGMAGKTDWDNSVKPKRLFELSNRLLRKNGRLVMFAQEPYTSELITSAIPKLPFNYRLIWRKNHFANSLLAKDAPVSEYEDILVFTKESKNYDYEGNHPLRSYFRDVFEYVGVSKQALIDELGQRADHTFRFDSTQFALCTRETYQDLVDEFGIGDMDGFKPYDELDQIDDEFIPEHKQKFPVTFNLPDGEKYKSNVLEYAKDADGYHPTQKPVALMADLVRTYSNPDDLILDPFAGSGSTLVAAGRCEREYIGVEQKPEYAERARWRVGNPPEDPAHLRANDDAQTGLEAFGDD